MTSHSDILENLAQIHNFEVLHRIGVGSFSSVFSIQDQVKKRIFAIKVAKIVNNLEIKKWPKLLHPNIIPVWEIMPCGKDVIAYKIPLCLHSISSVIQSSQLCNANDGFQCVCIWTSQIACALQYLHHQNLRHLDIKLDNILLSQKRNALLSDFSCISASEYLLKSSISSMHHRWKPPELWDSDPETLHDTAKLDLWCLGIASLEMFTRNALLRSIRSSENVEPECRIIENFILSLGDVSCLYHLMRSAFPSSCVNDNDSMKCQLYLSLFLQMEPQQREDISIILKQCALNPYDRKTPEHGGHKSI